MSALEELRSRAAAYLDNRYPSSGFLGFVVRFSREPLTASAGENGGAVERQTIMAPPSVPVARVQTRRRAYSVGSVRSVISSDTSESSDASSDAASDGGGEEKMPRVDAGEVIRGVRVLDAQPSALGVEVVKFVRRVGYGVWYEKVRELLEESIWTEDDGGYISPQVLFDDLFPADWDESGLRVANAADFRNAFACQWEYIIDFYKEQVTITAKDDKLSYTQPFDMISHTFLSSISRKHYEVAFDGHVDSACQVPNSSVRPPLFYPLDDEEDGEEVPVTPAPGMTGLGLIPVPARRVAIPAGALSGFRLPSIETITTFGRLHRETLRVVDGEGARPLPTPEMMAEVNGYNEFRRFLASTQ